MTLTSLEDQVMQKLLAGDDQTLAVLRNQLDHAQVTSRKMTGVGFYSYFLIPPNLARISNRSSIKVGDVNGTATNVKHGLGFLLYIVDGALSMLEGYTYDEPWPDDIRGLALTYAGGRIRNLKGLTGT